MQNVLYTMLLKASCSLGVVSNHWLKLKLMNAIDCQLVRVEPLEALPPI